MIAGSDVRFGEKCLNGPSIKLASMTMRRTISIQAIYGIVTISLVQSGPTGITAVREEGIGFITRVVMTVCVLESNKTTLKLFCNLDFEKLYMLLPHYYRRHANLTSMVPMTPSSAGRAHRVKEAGFGVGQGREETWLSLNHDHTSSVYLGPKQ